jgi:hypothetical protein
LISGAVEQLAVSISREGAPSPRGSSNDRVEKLEDEVKNLRAEFASLQKTFEEFRKQFE